MSHQHLQKHNGYQNCAVYSPDGELMFRCAVKRARWYLKRDLAVILSDDPLRIRLTFEPQGRGHAGNAYYLAPKKNRCVVCGREDRLTKHHVVPLCYRKFFPEDLKSHTSYDVFLVCADHHEEYEEHAWNFKVELGEEYSAPVNKPKQKAEAEPLDKEFARACKAASALERHGHQIPDARKRELEAVIAGYAEEGESAEETKNRLVAYRSARYDKKEDTTNADSETWMKVVERVEDLGNFIRRWRRHFVDNMNPQYLPDHWEVEKDWRGY